MTPTSITRGTRLAHAAAALLLLALSASAAIAADASSPQSVRDVGRAFEAARLLSGADRIAALESVDHDAMSLLKVRTSDDDRRAALFLSAAVQTEMNDTRGALDAWRRAESATAGTVFADDASFSVVRALESAGRDGEAAREWDRWFKRYPSSPLTGEAHLAAAWNALRRGVPAEAERHLTALSASAPWIATSPRGMLARATALYTAGKNADALAALSQKPTGVAATYLRGLCLRAQGRLLPAAAAFQDAAERYPDSPLRDRALLAKANTFLTAGDYRSASDEFARVAERVHTPEIKAEAELRAAGALLLGNRTDDALTQLRAVVERYPKTDVAARAQFLVGQTLIAQDKPAEAIIEMNRVLSTYFQHEVAASAQYAVARCLDRLGRPADATGAYQAVVRGYSLAPEAPAAAYLAGIGLMAQNRPIAATPYFQLVLDRYAPWDAQKKEIVFASPEHQELVEASLCFLELAYHRAGDLGQLSGAPHILLQRLPASKSPWRAYALVIDADAQAAQGHYPEAQDALHALLTQFPDHPVTTSALKLLAWTYGQEGRDSMAITTEEQLLARGGARDDGVMAAAFLDIAHSRFNQKRYRDAAAAYEDFLHRFPNRPERLTALYQAGLCYLRLNRAGDAVDRWERIVTDSAAAPRAERAWARLGDLYFQAEKYENAKRCYQGLLTNFGGSSTASLATLRLAQCEYNAGHDEPALEGFSATMEHYPGTPAAREAQRGSEAALYRLSQRPDGAEVLSRLVEQYPTSAFAADAQFQSARRLYQEKRYAEAADAFRLVVSRFPGYSSTDQAQFLMAESYAEAGHVDEARQAYEQFTAFFPSSDLAPTVRFRLGLLQFEAKDYMRAAVTFTAVLGDSASPEVRSAARYNLALCQRQLGQADEARTALEAYRHDFPHDARTAEVALQLGDLAETAGQPAAAEREFTRGLASSPRPAVETELAFRLGRIREQMGNGDAALRAYHQAEAARDRDDPFRLSALARIAVLYEQRHLYTKALGVYRDIAQNATDKELRVAAAGRATEIETRLRRR